MSDSYMNNQIRKVAEENNVQAPRAFEIVTERALEQIPGFTVKTQDAREYADGTKNRADAHVAHQSPGGPSIVVDAKNVQTLTHADVDKTIRDMKESRATAGVLVVKEETTISEGVRAKAEQNNVQIVEANRKLPSNLKTAIVEGVTNGCTVGPAVLLNSDGTVNRNSAAVKSGEVLVRQDGKPDGRSAAVRNGDLLLTNDGHADGRSKIMHEHTSPGGKKAVADLTASLSKTTISSPSKSQSSASSSSPKASSSTSSSSSYSSPSSYSSSSSSSPTVYTGPRGGHYTITSSGGKRYV